MKGSFAGQSIMKDEIQAATKKIKSSKTTGGGSILVELLEPLEDYGIDKMEIYCITKNLCHMSYTMRHFQIHIYNQKQQNANNIERSVLRVISPKYF